MTSENIIYEKDETTGVGRITINRPEVRNALNQATKYELIEILKIVREDYDLRVLVITGAGDKAFAAGADINEFKGVTPVIMERRASTTGQRLFNDIENLRMPVIAMINGYCFGGGNELALACDIRIASETAKFGQQEVNLGLIPGAGGTQRLPRLVGWGIAKELIFTGRTIGAFEAEQIGMVDKVVPPEALEETVAELCNTIASKSPLSISLAKRAINRGLYDGFSAGLHYEKECISLCFSTEDQKEGLRAFFEKRHPIFKGK